VVQEYIVDASVLIQGFIRDTDTARAQTLLKSLFDPEPAILHIPEFCLLECTNILWKQVQFHSIPLVGMQKAVNRLLSTPLTVQPVIGLLPRALTIGVQENLAIYDSLYLALGESLKHPLITVDVRQAAAANKVGIALKALTDFPELKT